MSTQAKEPRRSNATIWAWICTAMWTMAFVIVAYSNETGQEFRSLTGRSFQHYTGRVCEAKPDAPSVPGSELIIVGEYWNGQA